MNFRQWKERQLYSNTDWYLVLLQSVVGIFLLIGIIEIITLYKMVLQCF